MKGSKRDRTARLLRVAHILHQYPNGIPILKLAELAEVSVRTAYRDLRALDEELKLPVWKDERGRYGLETGRLLPPVKLTLLEATALFLAARLVSRYSDERDRNIESAFAKLASVLPRAVAQHVNETIRGMQGRPENPHYARVFEILATGWANGRRVRIWYPWSGSGVTKVYERLVEPYFLEPSPIGHACYLIAYCHYARGLRTFKVERIRDAQLTDDPYEVPEDFDPNAYLKASWGVVADEEVEVHLRFSPTVAARVLECVWHPSQSVTRLEDGGLDFVVTVAGTMEITPWVLSWGDQVEVISPPSLRERVASVALTMAQIYQASSSSASI